MAKQSFTSVASAVSSRVTKPTVAYCCRATELSPVWNLLLPDEPVALDIQVQEFKHSSWVNWQHRVGRVTIVNHNGDTVLDVYAAYPKENGVSKKMPAPQCVTHEDLMFTNGAEAASKVESWVKEIVEHRTVIVHGAKRVLTAFVIEDGVFAKSKVIDTQQTYSHLQSDGKPSLQTTAKAVLDVSMHSSGHSPVEKAQTALKLWKQSGSSVRATAMQKAETELTERLESWKAARRAQMERAGFQWWLTKTSVVPKVVEAPPPVPVQAAPRTKDVKEFPALPVQAAALTADADECTTSSAAKSRGRRRRGVKVRLYG